MGNRHTPNLAFARGASKHDLLHVGMYGILYSPTAKLTDQRSAEQRTDGVPNGVYRPVKTSVPFLRDCLCRVYALQSCMLGFPCYNQLLLCLSCAYAHCPVTSLRVSVTSYNLCVHLHGCQDLVINAEVNFGILPS